MKQTEYDFEQKECAENSCYNCYCNGLPICFKSHVKKAVKDFPCRKFDQLTEKEQKKILKLEDCR